jgi:hypothetical protein
VLVHRVREHTQVIIEESFPVPAPSGVEDEKKSQIDT